MSATRVIHKRGWRVRLDLSEQVLSLDVPEWDWARRDDRLSPTMPYGDNDQLVSAAALLMKAKQFDDGLYAAVELAAQAGAGRFPGKASLLAALAAALPDAPDAAARVFGACHLGGVPARPPADLQEAVAAVVNDFLGDDLRSKPLGFYTWTPELEAIFRQDRLLQGRLPPETAAALQRALDEAPGARA